MTVEANLILQRQHAAVILARQAAMREVKRRRQKQGIKGALPFSTLTRVGNELAASSGADLPRPRLPDCARVRGGAQKTEAEKSSTSALSSAMERGNESSATLGSALTASRLKANTPLSGRPVQRRSSLRR
jgi:hypothetical protein